MIPVMKKLKSKSGISLAIALVFFLLCAMVGTVVLSAASVSAGNTARERQLYRETLAMTSAAQLLRQEIQVMTFQGSCKKTEAVTTTVPNNPGEGSTTVTTTEEWEKGDAPELTGGTLFDISNLNLSDLYYSKQEKLLPPPAPSTPVVQTLIFQPDADRNIPEVKGTVTVATDYNITVVLQCGENSMTLTFPAQTNAEAEVRDPTVTQVGTNTSIKKTVTVYTTTVSWGAPTIREGGAGA